MSSTQVHNISVKCAKRPAGPPDADLRQKIARHAASSLCLEGFEITAEEAQALLELRGQPRQ